MFLDYLILANFDCIWASLCYCMIYFVCDLFDWIGGLISICVFIGLFVWGKLAWLFDCLLDGCAVVDFFDVCLLGFAGGFWMLAVWLRVIVTLFGFVSTFCL